MMKTALLLALLASMADAKCSTCELVDDVLHGHIIKVTHAASELPDADTHRCWNQAAELDSHYTVKGAGSDGLLDEQAELDSTLHEVRCCSDTDIGTGAVTGALYKEKFPDTCPSIWGSSISCVAPATYTAAKQHCEDDGARLCTREEMRNDCTKMSGCSLDGKMIWTSSPAEDHCMCECMNHGSDSHLLAKGSGGGATVATANTESHHVRCCSDFPHDSTNAAGGMAYKKNDGCSVWGASELDSAKGSANADTDGCVSAATYSEAEDHCLADGARLCTVEEMHNDCTEWTGCGFDGKMIWTMTPA
jgi:hypothetical protein